MIDYAPGGMTRMTLSCQLRGPATPHRTAITSPSCKPRSRRGFAIRPRRETAGCGCGAERPALARRPQSSAHPRPRSGELKGSA
eukprot:7487155-Pyramimonas_sp.AAC.1